MEHARCAGKANRWDCVGRPPLCAVAGCGGTPGMLAISATLGSMVAGTYTGHVAVTATGAQGSPAAIIATFIVNAQAANSPFSPQWGSNPQHTGMVGVSGQNLTNKLANIVYDPF